MIPPIDFLIYVVVRQMMSFAQEVKTCCMQYIFSKAMESRVELWFPVQIQETFSEISSSLVD